MGGWLPVRRCAFAGAIVAIVVAFSSERAVAGEYAVASCQSDQLNFSTRAFEDFATRGMKIRRACNPEGPGLRGLITSNVVRDRRLERGSVALATMEAPDGTRFTSFRWGGSVRRRDCRFALQLWADGPEVAPIPIKNVRANQGCPGEATRQLKGYDVETFDVSGATQIVQRVICVGGNGRKYCSARGLNYIRTYKAEVGIADVGAPAVSILGDTPLARGEWVRGTQPLNYDASDNVGVRRADVFVAGRSGAFHARPCAFAAPENLFVERIPCPNGPGQIGVITERFPEGTQPLAVQAQDTAGNVGTSAAGTARIDNSPPGRVDAAVEGGEAWRSRNDFGVAWVNPPELDRAPISAASFKLCAPGGENCTRGEQVGPDIARFGVQVPAPGEWTLSLWRRDEPATRPRRPHRCR